MEAILLLVMNNTYTYIPNKNLLKEWNVLMCLDCVNVSFDLSCGDLQPRDFSFILCIC